MSDLAATAERLREVKQATRRFLLLWAQDTARDRNGESDETSKIEAELADFKNHDWSLLYRGSVLDD